jgi:hypothetical protein
VALAPSRRMVEQYSALLCRADLACAVAAAEWVRRLPSCRVDRGLVLPWHSMCDSRQVFNFSPGCTLLALNSFSHLPPDGGRDALSAASVSGIPLGVFILPRRTLRHRARFNKFWTTWDDDILHRRPSAGSYEAVVIPGM